MYFLLNLGHCVSSYEHFICQILACFTMPIHQIWSCYMTNVANFENILIWPNSAFKFRKVTKLLMDKFSTSEISSQKPHEGGGTLPSPPVLLGLRCLQASDMMTFLQLLCWKLYVLA